MVNNTIKRYYFEAQNDTSPEKRASMPSARSELFRLDIKLLAHGIDARFSGDVSICASK